MFSKLKKLLGDEGTPTAIEYAVLVAGISVVIIALVFLLGPRVKGALEPAASPVSVPVTAPASVP